MKNTAIKTPLTKDREHLNKEIDALRYHYIALISELDIRRKNLREQIGKFEEEKNSYKNIPGFDIRIYDETMKHNLRQMQVLTFTIMALTERLYKSETRK